MKQVLSETLETFEYSATFMRRKGRGICYAHLVEWITPLGDTIDGSVLINGRLTVSKLYATKEIQAEDFFFTWQDSFGELHSRCFFLNHLSARSRIRTGSVSSKRDKRFAVEIDSILVSICNRIFFRQSFRMCMSFSSYSI